MLFYPKRFGSFALLSRCLPLSTLTSLLALLACTSMSAQLNPFPAAGKPPAAAGQGKDSAANTQEVATEQLQTAAPSYAQSPREQAQSVDASPDRSVAAVPAESGNSANPEPTPASSTVAAPAESGDSADAAKDAAQNPLAKTISIPFQNNTFFDVGPYMRLKRPIGSLAMRTLRCLRVVFSASGRVTVSEWDFITTESVGH